MILGSSKREKPDMCRPPPSFCLEEMRGKAFQSFSLTVLALDLVVLGQSQISSGLCGPTQLFRSSLQVLCFSYFMIPGFNGLAVEAHILRISMMLTLLKARKPSGVFFFFITHRRIFLLVARRESFIPASMVVPLPYFRAG